MIDLEAFLLSPRLQWGATPILNWHLLVLGLLGLILLWWLVRKSRDAKIERQMRQEMDAQNRAHEAEAQMAALLKSQAEMQGRMQTMAELFGTRQAELNKSVSERLDNMGSRLGQSVAEQTKSTHENLAKLQERLAVIDTAQNNIQSLAANVVELQSILSNKQTRGAFGQSRMEAIIADGLPSDSYEFQATLSNNMRPDCVIRMPNDAPSLVIDAKFPLEAWNAIRGAEKDGDVKEAIQRFRRDLDVHIKAISEKYVLKGETQDTAFLFVPSESIFAEIHENHEIIVQKALRARVVIVSPSLLMLSVQVIQAVLKDVRMREQAHLIQGEVTRLMEDIGRLDDRVQKLQTHFTQAQKDIDDISISSGKVTKRGRKIEQLEFETPPPAATVPQPPKVPQAHSKTGQLSLRVVQDDKES